MAEYSTLKVPELKKILGERGLTISGNKADLIARLEEDDKKTTGAPAPSAAAAEDEIDWDDEDNKPTAEPAAVAAVAAAGGPGPVTNPTAVPNQKIDIDPSTTKDLTTSKEDEAPKPTETTTESKDTTTTTSASETAAVAAATPAEPPKDFSIGLQKSDAEKEAEKMAQRAKRFGTGKPKDTEEEKKLERAKKFGLDKKVPDAIISGLDSALPDRSEKKGKRVHEEPQGGRAAKRATPDRKTGPKPGKKGTNVPPVPVVKNQPPVKKQQQQVKTKVTDDPAEKAKAEARAKRFAKPAAAA